MTICDPDKFERKPISTDLNILGESLSILLFREIQSHYLHHRVNSLLEKEHISYIVMTERASIFPPLTPTMIFVPPLPTCFCGNLIRAWY